MVAILLALSLGCGVSENHFWNETAELTCEQYAKCDSESYDAEYDKKSTCIDAQLASYDDYRDSYQDCDFDHGAAGACLSKKKKLNCEEYLQGEIEECKEVYSCTED